MDNRVVDIMESQGIDVKKMVTDSYLKLHEADGVGFGDKDKGMFVSFLFARNDGSYYKDTIPVMFSKEDEAGGIAYSYAHIISAYFEIEQESKYNLYHRIDETIYKH